MRNFTYSKFFNKYTSKLKFLIVFVIVFNCKLIAQDIYNVEHEDECNSAFRLEQTSYKIGYANAINFQTITVENGQTSWTISGSSNMQKPLFFFRHQQKVFLLKGVEQWCQQL